MRISADCSPFHPKTSTMAAGLVRCFHQRLQPNEIFWRLRSTPADFCSLSCVSVPLFPLRKEKLVFPQKVNLLCGKEQTLSSCVPMYTGVYLWQSAKSEEINGMMSRLFSFIMEIINGHQEVTAFSFGKAVALTYLLMLILPYEVLAETCEANSSIVRMPLLFAVALTGATVGGLLARRRRNELKRLNDQLRQINEALRRQAKIETYAPSLSYAPVGKIQEKEIIVDPRKQELLTRFRTGKNFLRNQDPEKAFMEFNAAFELAEILGDQLEIKKAARGLGASLQRQGKYREAIRYYSKVLEISKQVGDDSGSTEAYGAIADCYSELGDLERAGKFYDKYIARLEND